MSEGKLIRFPPFLAPGNPRPRSRTIPTAPTIPSITPQNPFNITCPSDERCDHPQERLASLCQVVKKRSFILGERKRSSDLSRQAVSTPFLPASLRFLSAATFAACDDIKKITTRLWKATIDAFQPDDQSSGVVRQHPLMSTTISTRAILRDAAAIKMCRLVLHISNTSERQKTMRTPSTKTEHTETAAESQKNNCQQVPTGHYHGDHRHQHHLYISVLPSIELQNSSRPRSESKSPWTSDRQPCCSMKHRGTSHTSPHTTFAEVNFLQKWRAAKRRHSTAAQYVSENEENRNTVHFATQILATTFHVCRVPVILLHPQHPCFVFSKNAPTRRNQS